MGRGNASLLAASGSHDQGGRHAHMVKTFKNGGRIFTKFGMYRWRLQSIIVCSNDDPGLTFTYFTARSYLVT